MSIPCPFMPCLFFYIFILLLITTPPMAFSVSDAEALLKIKDSLDNPEPLDSWKEGTIPCDKVTRWVGLVCGNGLVTDLRLKELGLSGIINIDALSQIEGLRTISLDNNAFSGPIPDFNRLGALKAIYLTGNQFTGEIPDDYFSQMISLKKVWLASNNFSGKIPSSLAQLPHLIDLHVEDNLFSGSIPSLEQESLESVGFSNNNLTGEIPSSLAKFDAKVFEGNPGLCGAKLGKACEKPTTATTTTTKPLQGSPETPQVYVTQENKAIAFGLMIVAGFILLLMIIGIFVLSRQRRNETFEGMEKENILDDRSVGLSVSSTTSTSVIKKEAEPSRRSTSSSRKGSGSSHGNRGVGDLVLVNEEKGVFGLADLMKAAAEVLGNGALGSSYKAVMCNGVSVVVKRLKDMNKMGKEGFEAEMKRLGGLNHRNILSPLAYHYRKEEKLLVYEYIPKGSLLYLLHGDRGLSHAELTWPVRLKIIRGIAHGLGYLHTELAMLDLPHGDLKSSNVLLDSDFDPLLADYGFCSLINTNQSVQALVAYKSPEAVQHNQVSPKCDVFCLGIIILEIITGKFPCQYLSNGKGGTDVVQWVKSAIADGREGDLFDPDIAGSSKDCLVQMEKVLHIGAGCTESNPEKRLDIREAIRRIDEINVQYSGGKGEKSIQILPSLRDGYADAALPQTHVTFVTEGPGDDTKHDSIGSGRRIGDSFAFDIS